MGILGLHHVAVSVPDLEEGLAFSCDVLGFEKVQRWCVPIGSVVAREERYRGESVTGVGGSSS